MDAIEYEGKRYRLTAVPYTEELCSGCCFAVNGAAVDSVCKTVNNLSKKSCVELLDILSSEFTSVYKEVK